MRNYYLELSDAKQHITMTLCRAVKGERPIDDLAAALDVLNSAWGRLTDCLVRQRQERDKVILQLLDELAEERTKK
jgi:hypothetical protein